MKYTEKQKKEIERVIDVFTGYLDNSADMDIAYSKKIGYFFIDVNVEKSHIVGESEIINEPKDIVYDIFDSFVQEILEDSGKEHDLGNADEEEIIAIKRKMQHYVELLPEYQYVMNEIMKGL